MDLDDLDIPADLLEWDELRADSGGLGRWLLGGAELDPKQPPQQQQQQQTGWQQQQQAPASTGVAAASTPAAAGGLVQAASMGPPAPVQPPVSGFMGTALGPGSPPGAAAVCLPTQQLAQAPYLGSPPASLGLLGGVHIDGSALSPHHLAQLQQMFNPSLLLSAVAPAAGAAAGMGGYAAAAAGVSTGLVAPPVHQQQQQACAPMDVYARQCQQQQQHPGSIMDMLAHQQQQQQQPPPGSLLELLASQQEQPAWAQANGHMAQGPGMAAAAQQMPMAAGQASFTNPGLLPLQLPSAGSNSLASPLQPYPCPDSAHTMMGPPALQPWTPAAAAAAAGCGGHVKADAGAAGRASRVRRDSGSTSITRPPARPSLSAGQLGLTPKSGGDGKGGAAGAGMQLTVSAEELADTVPGWNSMTVMQKYHYRRKVNLQRMEQTLADKMAELQLLEEENEQLKQRAAILEVMVADVDKQLELMSHSDTHGAEQWLALLTAGNAGSPGRYQPGPGGGQRPLQVLFEEAAKVDMSGWTIDLLKDKWRLYVAQLRPLLEQVDAARRRSVQEAGGEQCATSRGPSKQQQQQGWCVQGAGGPGSDSSNSGGQPRPGGNLQTARAGGGPEAFPALSGDSHTSACSRESSMHEQLGVVDGITVWGGPGTDGIPLNLLAAVEGLVMSNYTWLVAMMTRSNLLTYEFLSADYEGAGRLAPGAGDPFWQGVVHFLGLSTAQLLEGSTCHKLGLRCRQAVNSERARLQQVLQKQPGSGNISLLPEMERMDGQVEAVTAMQRNVRREAVLRNMVGIHSINLLTLLQHARMAVASYPWFCSAWSVYAAIEQIHDHQQQQQQHAEQGSKKRQGAKSTSK